MNKIFTKEYWTSIDKNNDEYLSKIDIMKIYCKGISYAIIIAMIFGIVAFTGCNMFIEDRMYKGVVVNTETRFYHRSGGYHLLSHGGGWYAKPYVTIKYGKNKYVTEKNVGTY